jgi:hypothetical protein
MIEVLPCAEIRALAEVQQDSLGSGLGLLRYMPPDVVTRTQPVFFSFLSFSLSFFFFLQAGP